MIRILSYRFSAMGDVALCLPVLKAVLALNTQVEITFVTRSEFTFIFRDIQRLNVIGVNFKKEEKGIWGLYKLSKKLKKLHHFDAVCDLHQILRSFILNTFFINIPLYKINKERSKKNKFLKNPEMEKLKHTTQRYLDVFKSLKLTLPSSELELLQYNYTSDDSTLKTQQLVKMIQGKKIIGIAPFARHFTKTWPYEYLQEFIKKLANSDVKIFLFGGMEDAIKLKPLEKIHSNIICLAGEYTLPEALALMREVECMVTMDSANMHFATLCNIPIISIWGGTHPGMGFYPLDPKAKIIQVPASQLDCRPCAQFGKPQCPEGHFQCMYRITPEQIVQEVQPYLP